MGAKEIEVQRSLVTDNKKSDIDVIIGLECKDEAFDLYIDSITSGDDIPENFKKPFSISLKSILYAKARAKQKQVNKIGALKASLDSEQNIFVYQISKNLNDNTVDIAYQFIHAYINIEKAHRIKKGKVVDNSYERLDDHQTIQIVSSLLGNVDGNYLQKAIDEEKKKLLGQ